MWLPVTYRDTAWTLQISGPYSSLELAEVFRRAIWQKTCWNSPRALKAETYDTRQPERRRGAKRPRVPQHTWKESGLQFGPTLGIMGYFGV